MATTANIPNQTGRRILITGANSGIGLSAALSLAHAGATVVLACRNLASGRAAQQSIAQQTNTPPELLELDLASQASIERAANEELARGQPLHCLINNAGVYAPPQRRLTEDGFELQFGTNVLGPFALTCRLLPALALAKGARVVTLASIAHKRGRIHFDDLQWERRYQATPAYCQSKLADLMFAFELERRLRAAGSTTISLAAHPGVAESNIFKLGSSTGLSRVLEKAVQGVIKLALNSTGQGALPTLFAATAPEARGGGYYGPQGLAEMRGGDVGPAKIAPQALDQAAQLRLWQICEALTGQSF